MFSGTSASVVVNYFVRNALLWGRFQELKGRLNTCRPYHTRLPSTYAENLFLTCVGIFLGPYMIIANIINAVSGECYFIRKEYVWNITTIVIGPPTKLHSLGIII